MIVEACVKVAFETGRFFLMLREKGVIRGKLLQRNGIMGAAGATLWLYDFSREKHVRTTTAAYSGSFAFGEVQPGSFRVDVKYGAYMFTDMERLYLGRGKDLFVEMTLPINALHNPESKKIHDNDVALDVITSGGLLKPNRANFKDVILPRIGDPYSITVTNRSSRKLLAVITVDGLSVMNGERGDYYSGGYVLSPTSRIDVPGWRIDDSTVAKFVFLDKEQSYAALANRPTNVGVIACAFFEEEEPTWQINVLESRAIGTGFGEATEHRVRRVEFHREAAPSVIKRLFYTGIREQAEDSSFNPNPFPGCKPPAGWTGK